MSVRIWNLVTAMIAMPARQSKTEALMEINMARQALGQEPLKDIPEGACKQPGGCALSNALGMYAGADGVCVSTKREARVLAAAWGTTWREVRNDTYVTNLPSALRGFVRDFDLGAYPELTASTQFPLPRAEKPAAPYVFSTAAQKTVAAYAH